MSLALLNIGNENCPKLKQRWTKFYATFVRGLNGKQVQKAKFHMQILISLSFSFVQKQNY
ncbi:hypothetical protein T05_1293 [Trichinella murrelli]|uniref:Uncharacterized protein n=1 Tax=Trichinella murrelli TaxID=144512 RepID=A0A0V0TX85_9BILA|nr:hypothetical protein T05_1293 [Trichinella murrelli]